jgi:uncharacterized zinc-type alcohol dehydrogenase-like protein
MLPTKGYAARAPKAPLGPFPFERREVGPHDVLIAIRYCGICRSDVHQARDEWGGAIFPMVPGHEIAGTVVRAGAAVSALRAGDVVGVGCMVDSCRRCEACRAGEEQYCAGQVSWTYNGLEQDGRTPTYGGYSDQIVVDERFVLRIPRSIPLERAAPLLCAGITTYSPLRHWKLARGQRLAVVGLGGLGHMAVRFGVAFGAEVTVLSHSPGKRDEAKRIGAAAFAVTGDDLQSLATSFDLILDTVSVPHDYNLYLELLKTDGTMVLVGAPERPSPVGAFPLINRRRRLAGSLIGGIRETQEMLDFCGREGISPDVKLIGVNEINDAYDCLARGEMPYRYVIDLASLGSAR